MKKVKQAARSLLLMVLLCALLTVPAFAADEDSVWVTLTETSGGTAAWIVTDTTVTDGVVELTYDSSALTYEGVTVTEAYVAMYSVNAEDAGIVRISWVAPGEYTPDAEGASLIQVSFSGTAKEDDISLSGSANDAAGKSVPVEGVRTSGSTTEPGTTEPGTTEPGTTEPGTTDPGTKPGTDHSGSTGNSGTTTNPGTTAGTGTGDSSRPGLFAGIAVCAAAAIIVIAFMMKRRRGER